MVETLAPMPHGPRLRLNDGNCDPQGRLLGRLPRARVPHLVGDLYVYDGELREVLTGVTISNGIGWCPTGRFMYYVDTRTHGVDVFDFDGLPMRSPVRDHRAGRP